MRTLYAVILAAVLVVTPALGAEDVEALRHIKTVLWPMAYRDQDVELLDRLLHDSFQMIDDQGERSSKADELAFVANNKWDPGTFDFRIERLQVFQGRFAVVDGTGVAESYSYKSSNFFIKEGGRWRAIASHVSGLQSRQAVSGSDAAQRHN